MLHPPIRQRPPLQIPYVLAHCHLKPPARQRLHRFGRDRRVDLPPLPRPIFPNRLPPVDRPTLPSVGPPDIGMHLFKDRIRIPRIKRRVQLVEVHKLFFKECQNPVEYHPGSLARALRCSPVLRPHPACAPALSASPAPRHLRPASPASRAACAVSPRRSDWSLFFSD